MRQHGLVLLVALPLLAGGCGPKEASQQRQGGFPGNKHIAEMVSKAASISPQLLGELLEMEIQPPWHLIENQSLTAVLLFGPVRWRVDDEEWQAKMPPIAGGMRKVGKAITGPSGDGSAYASVIRPEWVTSVTRKEGQNRVSGTVSFDCSLHRGRVNYVAERRDGRWRIVEISMPRSGIVTGLTNGGMWRAELAEPPGSGLPAPE